VPDLVRLLRHERGEVRNAAARVLSGLDARETFPALLPMLKDPLPETPPLILGLIDEWRVKSAGPDLLPLMREGPPGMRVRAATIAGRLQVAEAVPILIGMLDDVDDNVRLGAAQALGGFEAPEAKLPLVRTLDDETDEVAVAAAMALQRRSDRDLSSELIRRLKNPGQAAGWMELLARIGDPKAIPPIVELLDHQDRQIRIAAVSALSSFHARAAIPSLLRRLQNDPDDEVRNEAATLLATLGVRETIPLVLPLLKHRYCRLRMTAATVLGQLHHRDAAPQLFRCWRILRATSGRRRAGRWDGWVIGSRSPR
jgi:HEAT repeat protein